MLNVDRLQLTEPNRELRKVIGAEVPHKRKVLIKTTKNLHAHLIGKFKVQTVQPKSHHIVLQDKVLLTEREKLFQEVIQNKKVVVHIQQEQLKNQHIAQTETVQRALQEVQ